MSFYIQYSEYRNPDVLCFLLCLLSRIRISWNNLCISAHNYHSIAVLHTHDKKVIYWKARRGKDERQKEQGIWNGGRIEAKEVKA